MSSGGSYNYAQALEFEENTEIMLDMELPDASAPVLMDAAEPVSDPSV
jgi:hypothetical protein